MPNNDSSPADRDRLVAEIMADLPKCDSYTDLLGFVICAVSDVVILNERAKGVTEFNLIALLQAATDKVLETWREEMPHLWVGYCDENGLPAGEQ